MLELYKQFKAGTLTEEDVVTEIYTGLGSSLYAYMIMLENADRKREALKMKEFRDRIFRARDHWQEKGDTSCKEMREVSIELRTIYEMLQIWQPKESSILQSVVNEFIGFVWKLEEMDKAKAA